ncbi:MAG TPA: hypothetical protein VGM50_11760 [Gemmatimonadaceae bacterium]|jgi:hypothetical protein
MTSRLLYRIAAVLLLLFAVGHTMGFVGFVPTTAEGAAVHDAMVNVHFPIGKSEFTYQGFYLGFGLFVTAYLLFAAVLAWQLGDLASTAPHIVRSIGWMLLAVQAASLVLSCIYFFAVPIAFSAVVVVCLAAAVWRVPPTVR